MNGVKGGQGRDATEVVAAAKVMVWLVVAAAAALIVLWIKGASPP